MPSTLVNPPRSSASINSLAPYIYLLFFWITSIWHIDRLPIIHVDEPWILSPGFKLFSQGQFGSDLFAGFHGMEQIYFEFMPLMSLLQGTSTAMLGVGVLQMRFLPVVLGGLTLGLSYRLARQTTSPSIANLTLLLLVFWQWTAGNTRLLGSGVPLLDIARIARYDILVAPLGLGALLLWIRARRRQSWLWYFLSGILIGFAGLAHLYGSFWLLIIFILHTLDHLWFTRQSWWRALGLIGGGAGMIWLLWIIVALANWDLFIGQTTQYGDRFNLWDVRFYLQNIATETQRYNLGIRSSLSVLRLGVWVVGLGLPLAFIYVGQKAWRTHSRQMVWLLVPAFIFPVLFALLISTKTFGYLIVVVPFFAVLVAKSLHALATYQPWTRWVTQGFITLLVLQGAWSIGNMHLFANRYGQDLQVFYKRLNEHTPATGLILGSPQYWLAMPQRDYRAHILPLFLSNPRLNAEPIEYEVALDTIRPDIVFVSQHIADVFDNYGDHLGKDSKTHLMKYLKNKKARLIADIEDNFGEEFRIYQITWEP